MVIVSQRKNYISSTRNVELWKFGFIPREYCGIYNSQKKKKKVQHKINCTYLTIHLCN